MCKPVSLFFTTLHQHQRFHLLAVTITVKLRLFLLLLFIPSLAASQSLSVTGMSSLEFGTEIFPGIDKTVDRTEGDAAHYEISGEADREVQITFQLPSSLTDGSGNSLSITFTSTDAGYSTDELGQSTATAFDPHTGVITSLGTDGNLYIWLGGTVSPLSSQPGNPYDGDLILDITYTN